VVAPVTFKAFRVDVPTPVTSPVNVVAPVTFKEFRVDVPTPVTSPHQLVW
jgi:hypothetical protein